MAAERLDAAALASAVVGQTLYTLDRAESNTVLSVRGDAVMVRTKDTRERDGSAVRLSLIQAAADALSRDGELRLTPEELGHRRTSFVGALLATDPRVIPLTKPMRLRLRANVDPASHLKEALALIPEPRVTDGAKRGEPLYDLMVKRLRDEVATLVGDEQTYKIEGSAGRGNWAETPWVGVFDRSVTESATRGHYIVYLFRRDGERVFLSLNQGTTAVYNTERRGYQETLSGRALEYVGLLGARRLQGLELGPIDLGGGRPPLTPGYEAGNIAAVSYARGGLPDNATLTQDLARMLGLYSALTERIDRIDAGAERPLGKGAGTFEEERRLRWHRRYEGRNRSVVAAAKKAQGLTCRGCDVNYRELYGQPGERCVDAHHLLPFAELGAGVRKLHPIRDFAIVCSNCHRLIHSRREPLTILELRELLGR
jgi:5-methylcytosine-specific restriction protein A